MDWFLDRGFAREEVVGRAWSLLGGAASLRALVDWDWDSYSTEVLRGTAAAVRVEPEAQELFGSMSVAAWWKAAAIFTEVSLTLHFSGSSAWGSEFCR
jgi:hypothetical protein